MPLEFDGITCKKRYTVWMLYLHCGILFKFPVFMPFLSQQQKNNDTENGL